MITVLGSAYLDLAVRVPHIPARGERVVATSLQRTPGGKGVSQAVAAARAGSRTALIARLGDDAEGSAIRACLRLAGVDMEHVMVDGAAPTGTTLTALDERGETSVIAVPGANDLLSPHDLDRASDIIEQSGVLLVQLEVPLDTVAPAAQLARAVGAHVLLNAAPASTLNPMTLSLMDLVVGNEQEIAFLAGMGAPVDPAAAAGLLLPCGVKAVVVTLGAQGSVVVSPGVETDIPAFEVEVVDRTGAGDAFVGNLAHALDDGQDLEAAVRFASAAAACSVQGAGGLSSMPTLDQTRRLLAEAER